MMKNITLKQVLRQHALLGCIALLPLSPVYSQADNQQIAFRVPKAGDGLQPADVPQIPLSEAKCIT